jgi:transposase
MTHFKVDLSETEQATVAAERYTHPDLHVRRKMLVLWTVHSGLTHRQAAQVAGVGRATVQRYLATYRDGGLEGLRRWKVVGPVSELARHADALKASLSETPVRTVA